MYPPHQHPHQMPPYQNQTLLPQQQQPGGAGQPGNGMPQGPQHQSQEFINQGPEPETVYLYIPNVAVGAIIGTKGSFIKNIIKLSGASVKITPLTPEESKNVVERQVVIVGKSTLFICYWLFSPLIGSDLFQVILLRVTITLLERRTTCYYFLIFKGFLRLSL